MQSIVKVSKYLQLPLGKDLIQIPLGDVEQLGKLVIALQTVYLILTVYRTGLPGVSSDAAGAACCCAVLRCTVISCFV